MRRSIVKLGLAILVMAVAGMAFACGEEKETSQQPSKEIVINLTVGKGDPHRATLALLMADSAVKTGHKVTLFLNVDAVELATKDLPDTVKFFQFPSVRELMAQLVGEGATILACPVCLNAAGIPADQLIDGVVLATPNDLFPHFDAGAAVISY
jgi:predicted peroxiredoxin